MTLLLLFKLILIPLGAWRLYRAFALDTGLFCMFRWIRIKVGVKYKINEDKSVDYKHWSTKDGSIAEGLTCSNCAPVWWAEVLSLLAFYASDQVYWFIAIPLNASAIVLFVENILYAPRVKN